MKGEWWALLGDGSVAIFKDKSSGHYLEREMVVAVIWRGRECLEGKMFCRDVVIEWKGLRQSLQWRKSTCVSP